MNIAIYDLDKTITRRPTFTRFLLYFARRTASFRLVGLPIWVMALIGYRMGLYGRKPLKQFGISMFMGRNLDAATLAKVVADFVSEVVLPDILPGAAESIEKDRSKNQKLVIASAAPAFYADKIGELMGFDAVVATRHRLRPDGRIRHLMDGENCYGLEKLKMVGTWFDAQGLKREDCHISVYSDHASDAPLMDWADAAFLVNPSKKLRKLAAQKNWQVRDFSSAKGH
jgi:HAD superfamily hydrolase (TIGR01490 family)